MKTFVFDFESLFTQLFNFIEIDPPKDFVVPEPRIKRQADKVNEEWIERMRPILEPSNSNQIGLQ